METREITTTSVTDFEHIYEGKDISLHISRRASAIKYELDCGRIHIVTEIQGTAVKAFENGKLIFL